MEAVERKESEMVHSAHPKKPRHPSKKVYDQRYNKSRINIGDAFERWSHLKKDMGFKTNSKLAHFLIDRVCGEHLSQDKSSTSPKNRGRSRQSQTKGDSPQPSPGQSETESASSPDPQIEDLDVSHDLSPLQPYQLKEQPDQQIKDETDLDFMMGSIAPSCGFVPTPSATEDNNKTCWDEIKDELAQTTHPLEERLDTMRLLSVGGLADPVSITRGEGGQMDQKKDKWTINKNSLTGLFRTCPQCGEPVLEFKTLTSGSLVRIQWECSKGHLMWLFPNHNPT